MWFGRWLLISKPGSNPTLLLLAPNGSYRTLSYLRAARRLGLDVLAASDSSHSIVSELAAGLSVAFDEPDKALATILEACRFRNISCVMATDDKCVALASALAEQLQLIHNPTSASLLTQRKDLARQALQGTDCLIPRFQLYSLDSPQHDLQLDFPLVIKPLGLSASRGVIRANNQTEFEQALQRVSAILAISGRTGDEASQVLLESYIEGDEYAVEGFLVDGQFRLLTIFDKPDPMQGPYFEETYYISPSRLSEGEQRQVATVVANCCEAYGLQQGPVHAELRINASGIYLIELASRTIGGQCGRMIESILGLSLEELVLLGMTKNLPELRTTEESVGVLMIPIPQAGLLKRIEGVTDAMATEFVEDLEIHINPGYEMVPLPEGASYLGFIFARSPDFETTWRALRQAHEKLNFITQPSWELSYRG